MINLILYIFAISSFCGTLLFSNTAVYAKKGEDIMLKKLVNILNERRAIGKHCGKETFAPSGPLRWDNRLAKAAFAYALELAEYDRLSHEGQDGSNPGDRIRSAGYKWRAYGENIGEGYKTAEDMFTAWINSEGHCKNIMNPLFVDVGAARVVKAGKIYWVLLLGTPE